MTWCVSSMTLAGTLPSCICVSPRYLLVHERTPPLPRGLCTEYDSACPSSPGASETMPVRNRVDVQCNIATTMAPLLLRGFLPPRISIATCRIVRVWSTRSPTKSRRCRPVKGCRLTVEMQHRLRLACGTRTGVRTALTATWSIHGVRSGTVARILATTPSA